MANQGRKESTCRTDDRRAISHIRVIAEYGGIRRQTYARAAFEYRVESQRYEDLEPFDNDSDQKGRAGGKGLVARKG